MSTILLGDDTLTEATFVKSYKNREGVEWTLSAYLPVEGEDTMVLNNVASTKRKVYVEYPECYIEIKDAHGINAHHLMNEKEFKKLLHDWSGIWGSNFWQELKSKCLI